jgi:hypothetical protein
MIRKTTFLLVPVLVIFFVLVSGCTSETPLVKGTIQFTSSPAGAQVYLDNQYRGTTPCTVTGIETGSHTVEFRETGYQTWSNAIAVSSGANNVYASLQPVATGSVSPIPIIVVTTSQTTAVPVSVTIQAGREKMIVGETISFTGTASGCDNVVLTIYGPGSYAKGLAQPQVLVDSNGLWRYTWNPGTGIMPGTYTMIVSDPYKTVSDRAQFRVIGNGQVSIVPNSYSVAAGNTIQFSGLCTTGAQNVQLKLLGPGLYSNGVSLGSYPVKADSTWNTQYTLDMTMPTGYYTMYVYDEEKTASNMVQFSVGFV